MASGEVSIVDRFYWWGFDCQSATPGATCTQSRELDTVCWPTGNYQARLVINSGSGSQEACSLQTETKQSSFTVFGKPEVTLDHVGLNAQNQIVASGTFNFPNTTGSGDRLIELQWADKAETLYSYRPATESGTWVSGPLVCLPTRAAAIRAYASSCTGEKSRSGTGQIPQCDGTCDTSNKNSRSRASQYEESIGPSCPDCIGAPVHLSSSALEYEDADPIPGTVAGPMRRAYHSTHNDVTGYFGRGWVSIFDSGATALRGANLRETVVLRLEDERPIVFDEVDGSYVQSYPPNDAFAGTLEYVAGLFRYRAGASRMIREFRASDGRLVSIRLAGGDGVNIAYDAAPRPVSVADSQGRWSWVLGYDASNRISNIYPAGHPELTWTYSYTNGNLTTVTAPGNAVWRTYSYGAAGLETVSDGDGRTIEAHSYIPGTNKVLNSLAPSERITAITTNLSGRIPGETRTHAITADGNSLSYYRRFIGGKARTVEIEGSCSCGTDDTVFGYNSLGQVVREQDAKGYITLRTFMNGRMTRLGRFYRPSDCDPETDANACRLTPDDLLTTGLVSTALTTSTTLTYQNPNWPDLVTGRMTESVLAGATRMETMLYDTATGRMTRHSVTGYEPVPGDPGKTRTTTTTLYGAAETARFDPCGGTTCGFSAGWLTLPQPSGMPAFIDGPRNDVNDGVTYVYYPIASSVPADWRGHLAAIQNSLGHVTRYENYDAFGNALRVADPNGVITETTHDSIGRLLTSTIKGIPGCQTGADPLCGTDLTSRHMYSTGAGRLAIMIGPRGEATAYEYDNWGQTTAVIRGEITGTIPATAAAAIAAATWRERIEYVYSPTTGRKTMERILGKEGASWVETKTTSFAHDSSGHVSTVINPDGTTSSYVYEHGLLESARDENHTSPNTLYFYDAAGRLKRVQQTLATAPIGFITTSYAYDLHGNLTRVTDPNGNETTYVFDDFGQMQSQQSPVTGTTGYAYDPAGNVVSTVDANGATTTRAYDELNRVTSAVSIRSGKATETATWSYDGTTPFGRGRLSQMSDPAGSTSYQYERRGLLTGELRAQYPQEYETSYRYDESGNRAVIGNVEYTLDHAGRPVSAIAGGMPIVASASYYPFGPLKTLSYANGTAKAMTYDLRYRPMTNVLTAGATTLSNHSYASDGTGNITSIADALNAGYSRAFTYDDLNRLRTANTGPLLWVNGSYTYDAMGNILTTTLGSAAKTFSYQGTTPKLAAVTGFGSVTYDPAGNELTPAADYSARNHRVVEGNPLAVYRYDGRGVRVRREWTVTTPEHDELAADWLYTPELRVISTAFYRTTGFAWESIHSRQVIWFGDLPVAQYDIEGSPDVVVEPTVTLRFTFSDHLGTPILQTDEAGLVTWRAEYEPYGTVYTFVAGDRDDQPLRLPGQEDAYMRQADLGDYYNIFRRYRPGWGRYTQSDPLNLGVLSGDTVPGEYGISFFGQRSLRNFRMRSPQWDHAYGYVAGNPLRAADPKGLFGPGDLAGAGGIVCMLDTPVPGPADIIGGAIILIAGAWALSEGIDWARERDRTCRECDDTQEKCKKRCDRAYEALVGDCQRRFATNPAARARCYAEAAEVYADCLRDCGGR